MVLAECFPHGIASGVEVPDILRTPESVYGVAGKELGRKLSNFDGQRGTTAGLIVGIEPRASRVSAPLQLAGVMQDRNNSLHVEGFYEYKLNDHMAITPGIIWLTAPGHNKNNDAAVIGTIRTTLTF
jgi:Carbohydrate-selective porin, OprB family